MKVLGEEGEKKKDKVMKGLIGKRNRDLGNEVGARMNWGVWRVEKGLGVGERERHKLLKRLGGEGGQRFRGERDIKM